MADEITITIDSTTFLQNVDIAVEKVYQAAEQAVEDCINELARIASEAAPIDTGALRRSHEDTFVKRVGELSGKIEFSISEQQTNGKNFNYALWIHEGDYNLGAQSQAAPGTTGWSGKHYAVGKKYLERPIKGEEESCKKRIADEIRAVLGV